MNDSDAKSASKLIYAAIAFLSTIHAMAFGYLAIHALLIRYFEAFQITAPLTIVFAITSLTAARALDAMET